ncbi:16796_t:CDS:2 [Dentiscutata erythropus]|uniref:16796_t:CDS:1 n=1 Tax=Dentiscutata erythropus TaxID=1348616 RepID=A0A9N9DNQ7_9GLOM|nr:16796_t:CDS:2 [Dentiscutata erythropus]
MYGYDNPEVSCWYRDSGQNYNIIWQWITLFGWVDASILYCAIVVFMVIRKLSYATKNTDDFDSSQLSDYPTLINKNLFSSVVRRVMWYPMVPLAVQFFNSFVETYAYVNKAVPFLLLLLCDIGLSLEGLLNTLVFSQDIAISRAFQDVKLQLWISIVNTYESHYPHRSHNKAITDEFSMPKISNNFVELKALNYNKANPSLLEWLRYMLLIKLFSAPKISFQLISPKLLSQTDSFAGNKLDASSTHLGKDDSKHDIAHYNRNDDQDLDFPDPVHLKDSSSLDLSSNYLNSSTLSDPLIGSSKNNQTNRINISNTNNIHAPLNSTTNVIDISNCTLSDGEPTISEEFKKIYSSDIDLSEENETLRLMLKRI